MDISLQTKTKSRNTLVKRALVVIILLPFGLAAILLGGSVFTATVVLIMALAGWEYVQLFRAGGLQPAGVLVIGYAAIFAISRAVDGFASAAWLISLLILLSMTYHLFEFERGREYAATDFSITLGGAFYIGWIGAYMISLRNLPEGVWWFLLTLPVIWLADTGAYLVGSRLGRHKLSPRLSPKKTWEGYIGGIVTAAISGALLPLLFQIWSGPGTAVTPLRGMLLGLILGILTTLGDLGESMIKRQVGAKDSGNLLPGHGGAFDRVDSWLWAGVIAYYLISWLFY